MLFFDQAVERLMLWSFSNTSYSGSKILVVFVWWHCGWIQIAWWCSFAGYLVWKLFCDLVYHEFHMAVVWPDTVEITVLPLAITHCDRIAIVGKSIRLHDLEVSLYFSNFFPYISNMNNRTIFYGSIPLHRHNIKYNTFF